MKNSLSSRRGSALLIVLGILSFMVVSAVAFSVLMRQSRLPSSFMRQKVASAQLVKAGLAQAMAELDECIGDNPYPGVGTSGGSTTYGNYWRNRIFMRTQAAANATPDPNGDSGLDGAVSTLPFEGLAYVPPPLVNTVRYWMKMSPTAVWQTLGYDSGRFAYTAVNVSDYFDVNRLHANVMRDSSVSNRISMAYLFENSDHTGDGDVSPKDLDDGIADIRSDSENPRLVSMADYALAVHDNRFGNRLTSPFCTVVETGAKEFYSDEDNSALQKFVTDSWYPASLTNTTAKALTDNANQPFKDGFDDGFDSLLRNPLNDDAILRHLNFPERVAFKDYLDDDNVPTSLALPTAEYAPMLTGVMITPVADSFAFEVKCNEADDIVTPEVKNAAGEVTQKETVQRLWRINGFNGTPTIGAMVTAVFPFKRTSARLIGSLTSFSVQVLVKAYLVPDGGTTDETRLGGSFSCRPKTTGAWKDAWLLRDTSDPCLTFLGRGTLTLQNGGDAEEEKDALLSTTGGITMNAVSSSFTCPIYGVKVEKSDDDKWTLVGYDGGRVETSSDLLRAVDLKSGGVSSVAGDNKKFRWQFFAWVRVIGEDGKTVDLFPACFKDDEVYNGFSQGVIASNPTKVGESDKEAVLPLAGPLALDLQTATFVDSANVRKSDLAQGTGAGFDSSVSGSVKIYCCDPRYNWAPEDWYAATADLTPENWLSDAKGQLNGNNCRSRDIFQFVSNQAYLQSLGELQFIPLVRKNWSDCQDANPVGTSFCNSTTRYDGQPFANRTSPTQLANADYMWKTYTFFPDRGSWSGDDSEYDPYNWEDDGHPLVDSLGGMTVSPYADVDLFMAAVANTPYDYAIASEPESGQTKFSTLNEGRKYCFSAFSSEAKVEWQDLKAVAEELQAKLKTGEDWWSMDAWNSETGDTLFGQSVGCTLHDVDRKFLASYWKNCLGDRQQLFLVFVRAEPVVMGAAASGHTPAQLGARAVALVWREPESTIPASAASAGSGSATTTAKPHRMRILFYHQFEQ